jgi:photosystem II stability/assembly factor-like uncharacterized protein
VQIASKTAIWAVGGQSIYFSRDAGKTWTVRHRDANAVDLNDLAIVKSGIFVVGGWGLVIASRDAGMTWARIPLPNTLRDGYTAAIAFVDEQRGWIGGSQGVIMQTSDAGKSWVSDASGTEEFVRSITVAGKTVLAVGDNWMILRRHI